MLKAYILPVLINEVMFELQNNTALRANQMVVLFPLIERFKSNFSAQVGSLSR